MEKELSEIFKGLRTLNLNYNTDDFAKRYRSISNKIDINDYLEYTEKTRASYFGICHVVLSIRVSDKSDFVPFTSAMGAVNGKKASVIAKSLLEKHIIKYNFVDFIADFVKKKNLGNDIPRISFSTYIEDSGEVNIRDTIRFKTKDLNTPWYKPSDKDYRNEDFKSIIPQNKLQDEPQWDNSFVKVLSQAYYNELGLRTLFYTIISIDSTFNNTGRQTQILIISSNQDEASYFLDRTLERLREIASFIRTRYVDDLLLKNRYEAIKSSIAAIMSRNMSHNLGSHFISNTKNYFGALIERDPNNQKNYRGIKHALQYIQERMDFIATITSTETYPFGAVNAKAQIFDELTPDDFGCRHGQESYNFLMDYIVLSENISKKSWGGDGAVLSPGEHKMLLRIGHWDGKGEPDYWDPDPKIIEDENNKKRDEILGINFAIPGGILGRHAVFSIIENIIRNAAKHGQDKIKKDFVIRMLYRTDEHRFIVFDNKEDEDIKGTVKKMEGKLKRLRFLSPDGVLEQENKGLKEMLICAIWLQNENVAQVMADNDYETDEDKKLKNFKKYLEIVALDENGKKIKDVNDDTIGYLGYSFKLDQYEKVHYLEREEINSNGLNGIKADIVCYKEDFKIGEKRLSEIFPRFLVLSSEDEINKLGETEVLRRVVEKNCTSRALQRKMVVAYTTEYKGISSVVPFNKWCFDGDAFLFKGHAGKSKWDKFSALFLTKGFEDKYVDSISGGDFTYTLVQPSFVHDEYNMLKIKESVATRFVIIDERIFEHYKSEMKAVDRNDLINGVLKKQRKHTKKIDRINEIAEYIFGDYVTLGDSFNMSQIGSELKSEFLEFVGGKKEIIEFLKKDIEQHYQERRGIYIFNLGKIRDNKFNFEDLSFNVVDAEEDGFKWTGNDFIINSFDEVNGSYNYGTTQNNPNAMTFLSIHLGIIDKIREQIGLGDNDDDKIVEALKRFFKAKYVSIHTGRGGFDVRESLKQYAFQSFSTIENPLYNSKYLLAQQFYNINYYGSKDKNNYIDKKV